MHKSIRSIVTVLALALVTATGAAQTGSSGASPEDIAFANRLSSAFKSVAGKAEQAVVHITALRKIRTVQRDFFGFPVATGPERLAPTSLGSGFIVHDDGTILTNNHVVADADELSVKLFDGHEFPAKVVGRDEATDLAVIRLDTDAATVHLSPVSFGDSESLDVGEWVVAIGSPFGFSSTVTAGIVSAKGRSLTPRETGQAFEDYIQTDAAINPGNSGGPLLNLRGEVVGINTAIASHTGGYEGLGFAIPANLAKAVMENILANGRVVRGWLGVELQDTPASDTGPKGVRVSRVLEGSPADRAGLKEGDVITRFQGQVVNEARLRTAIGVTRPGTKTEFDLVREGKTQKIAVAMGDFSNYMTAQAEQRGEMYIDSLGATVKSFTREMARDAGYPQWVRGVRVEDVDPTGAGARAGLQPGDIVVQVDNNKLAGASELSKLSASGSLKAGAQLGVIRGRQQGFLQLK